MKLEQQCVSLELAKKLKELGVKQESYFSWMMTNRAEQIWDETMIYDYQGDTPTPARIASAFTVAELGEMLPDDIAEYKEKGQWNVLSEKFIKGYVGNEADCRAKMLIYLLENKLI